MLTVKAQVKNGLFDLKKDDFESNLTIRPEDFLLRRFEFFEGIYGAIARLDSVFRKMRLI